MNNYFTYSVLQYKHSLALGEVLNVGILFYFPEESKFEFASGNAHRAKSIYPDFDISLFNTYLKAITDKIKKHVDLFNSEKGNNDFAAYIHANILAQDAAGLIFDPPKQVKNVFKSNKKVVDEYSKLLLPGILTEKVTQIKHNESFIIKKYTQYIFETHKDLEEKFDKNVLVETKHLKLKFELGWQQGKKHLVKPISFDLADTQSIQTKAATFLGYLTQLQEYASEKNTNFDFLISKPQNKDLKNEYENALDLLNWAKDTPKTLVTEERWSEYYQQTIEDLLHN